MPIVARDFFRIARKATKMPKTKKHKKKNRRSTFNEPLVGVRPPQWQEDIIHIKGTLNAISSRLDDLWDYVVRWANADPVHKRHRSR